jgi:hypothetical protein
VTTSLTTDVTHTAEPFVTLDSVCRADDPAAPTGWPLAVAQPRYDLIFFKRARRKDTV